MGLVCDSLGVAKLDAACTLPRMLHFCNHATGAVLFDFPLPDALALPLGLRTGPGVVPAAALVARALVAGSAVGSSGCAQCSSV